MSIRDTNFGYIYIYIYIYREREREREKEDLESRRINRALLEKKILKINGEKLISRKFLSDGAQ